MIKPTRPQIFYALNVSPYSQVKICYYNKNFNFCMLLLFYRFKKTTIKCSYAKILNKIKLNSRIYLINLKNIEQK